MRFLITFIFFIVVLISSCNEKQEPGKIMLDFNQYFDKIAQTDVCLGEGEVLDDLRRRVDAVVKAPIDTINSVTTFEALYYEAHKRQQAAGPRTNQRCVDTNYAVKDRSLEKLALDKSNAAIAAIMGIYKDTNLTFPGNESKSLVRYMSQCGKPLLSELEEVKNLRPGIGPKVIANIKNQK